MKILVTGGTGFFGRHLIKRLIDLGHEVFNYSRSRCPKLESLGVICIQGNLTDREKIISALEGKDIVFHTASKVGVWGNKVDFENINVKGTQSVIDGCIKHGVTKLIYTSSPSAVFGDKSLMGVDESQEYPKKFAGAYGETKAKAEQLVLNANSTQVATVALRPHLIFGPGDHHLFPRIVDKAKSGKLRIIGDGNNLVDVIYVENAVDAHILAMEKLEIGSIISGKPYFLGQEKPVKVWDFVNKVLVKNKLPPLKKKISFKTAFRLGSALEIIYGAFKIKSEPPMTRFVAYQLACSHYFNHKNAENELGYHPKITIEEGLERTPRV